MSVDWVQDLRLAILASGPSERLPGFQALSDEQLDILVGLVIREGLARGFGEGWYD